MLNKKVPHVIFKTRVRDESIDGDNLEYYHDFNELTKNIME